MIPKHPCWVIFRNGKLVSEGFLTGNFQKYIIGIARGRDVQTVVMQVGGFGEVVGKVQADGIPGFNF